jgi:hypothetical protein
MADVFDAHGLKIASVSDDGKVRNAQGAVLGTVAVNGHVFNAMGQDVGQFLENGYIYKGSSHVGTVANDGTIRDYENVIVGRATGGHVKMAGAAMLLLAR